MSGTTVLGAFNKHFLEFVDEIESLFPDNKGIRGGKMALLTVKKINPRIILEGWKYYVVDKYKENIMSGDANLFIEKDYTEDLLSTNHPKMHVCLRHIDNIRDSVRNMGEENKTKSIKYMQNLTKLCDLYYSQKNNR
tara:strand:+ start:1015 stop:1425 length:411 start_codon:yes stop_codon:yes gene_type:complete